MKNAGYRMVSYILRTFGIRHLQINTLLNYHFSLSPALHLRYYFFCRFLLLIYPY